LVKDILNRFRFDCECKSLYLVIQIFFEYFCEKRQNVPLEIH